jgi:hypothetical protein
MTAADRLKALLDQWEIKPGDKHRPERRNSPTLWLANQRDDSLAFDVDDAVVFLDALSALEELVRAADTYVDIPDGKGRNTYGIELALEALEEALR